MMDATHEEHESKLQAPDDFSLARLPNRLGRYRAAPAEFRRLHTIYYDTEDGRLARWGCSLRYRVHEGWTLKLPAMTPSSGHALARVEHNFEGDSWPVPSRALDLVRAYTRGAEIVPVAELRTVRTKRAIRESDDGDVLADIVDDDVRVVAGAHVEKRFRQLEIERVNAPDDRVLDDLASALQREGAGSPDPMPKNVHAMGGSLSPEVIVPQLHSQSSVANVFIAAFGDALEHLIRLDSALRLDDNVEAIHEMRVAVRRLRSYLRTFRPILERAWADDLRERMTWMNQLLGRARNIDVLVGSLSESMRRMEPADAAMTATLFERLHDERTDAYDRVRAGLREARYDELLQALIEAARAPHLRPRAGRAAHEMESMVILGAVKRMVLARRAAAKHPTERDLHAIRIKVKHVRFAAEAFVPVSGKWAATIVSRAQALQDVLGAYHDAIGAVHRLRLDASDGSVAYAAGALAERSRREAARKRKGWRRTYRKLGATIRRR